MNIQGTYTVFQLNDVSSAEESVSLSYKSELSPVASLYMLSPTAMEMDQELSSATLEQMPSHMCNGFELLPVVLEQIPSPV